MGLLLRENDKSPAGGVLTFLVGKARNPVRNYHREAHQKMLKAKDGSIRVW